MSDSIVDACQGDWRQAAKEMDARQLALATFAEKLTRTPSAMSPADLDALRQVGLDDGGVLEATHVVGYFNHINRVADALGVDLEDWMDPPPPRDSHDSP